MVEGLGLEPGPRGSPCGASSQLPLLAHDALGVQHALPGVTLLHTLALHLERFSRRKTPTQPSEPSLASAPGPRLPEAPPPHS